MKIKLLCFSIFVLEFLMFQNIHAEKARSFKGVDPSTRRFVLWRVYTLPLDSNAEMYAIVDSVLKVDSTLKDFYTKEKFLFGGKKENINKLKPNTYYLILTMAAFDKTEKKYSLFWPGENNILPDTPENRKLLSKIWNETEVMYDEELWKTSGGMVIDGSRDGKRKKPDLAK